MEDGNFDWPVSGIRVIVGTTSELASPSAQLPGTARSSPNGYHRRPNPFENINVVGNWGLLLVAVVPSPIDRATTG